MRDTKVKGDANARFKVYGTKTCIHCQILKALLKGKGYPFCEEKKNENRCKGVAFFTLKKFTSKKF